MNLLDLVKVINTVKVYNLCINQSDFIKVATERNAVKLIDLTPLATINLPQNMVDSFHYRCTILGVKIWTCNKISNNYFMYEIGNDEKTLLNWSVPIPINLADKFNKISELKAFL